MDGSGPPRANAAQLAQRNIKASRGKRQGRATPVVSHAQFGQSQGVPAAQFGGGMFGGGIQAPTGGSGFNFAVAGAPPAPTFHNPFQQVNNTQSSGHSENDERRDPAEERPVKRRSGGTASGDSAPLFAPNPFGQDQSSIFGSTNGQQQNGGTFSFGQSTGFNSGGATNPFGTTTQATTPSLNFGGGSPAASTPFKFGQPSPQIETASTGFNFGSAATPAKPVSSTFSFGQTSGQPASTGISFGSMPATDAPANNLFGTSQPPSTNLFGSAPPQTTPGPFASLNAPAQASNLFGSREASPAPSANSGNLFGNQGQVAKPSVSNGLFGQQNQQPTPSKVAGGFFGTPTQPPTASTLFGQSQQKAPGTSTGNLFGASTQPSTASTSFGEPKSETTSTLFGNLNQTPSAPSTMFNKPVEKPNPSNNLFGSTPSQTAPSNNLFGGSLNKPVEQAVADPKTKNTSMFGTNGTQSQSSNLFNQPASSTGLFKGASSLSSAQPAPEPTSTSPNKPLFSFASTQPTPAPSFESSKPSMFSSTKPMEAPTSASEPPPSGMFPSLQPPSLQKSTINQSSPFQNGAQTQPANTPIKSLATNEPEKPHLHNGKNLKSFLSAKKISEEFMEPFIPRSFGENERKDFHVAYRMRALNNALAAYFSTMKSMTDPGPAFACYKEERSLIMDDYRVRIAKKRTTPHEAGIGQETPSKRPKQTDINATQAPTPSRRAPSPTKQQLGANNSKPYTNGNSAVPSPAKAPLFAPPQSGTPPASAGKRKADNDLTSENVGDVEKRPLRQIKTPKIGGSIERSSDESSGGSNTSNIFKNILDSPSKSPQKSPTMKTANLPSTSTDTLSKPNPFGGLPVPKSPIKDSAPKPNPFGGLPVPKSPTKDSASKPNPFGGLPVPKSPTKSAAPSPPAGLFGAKPAAPIQLTSPSVNMFGSKPVETSKSATPTPPSSSLFGSKPSLPPSNPFGSSTTPTQASSNIFGSKPPAAVVPPSSKGFSIAGLSAGTINFAAQFGQKAEQDKITSEQKKMQRDMDEDFDSEDDDKEEWIANWKEKRRVELENLDALAKSSKGGFTFGQTKTTKDSVAESDTKQSSKPLFGLSAPSQSNGGFSPANISRTPTPGAISSGAGSVFDSHTPGKLAPFNNNIFGHLSDSAKSDDADDESAEDSDPEADGDSENKDPNYTPQQESKSGPGTPASETGAGIASAKKSALFTFTPSKTGSVFGQSASGTTTPRGGLFDRISRDSNGNPIRATSPEEKENTQPPSTGAVSDIKNPFSALNKSQTAPADQTWKIDSPIKFGTTPTNDNKPTPTFNVTAATPTKTASPGIFGNLSSGPTSAPFSNLFGNLGAAKPAAAPGVGFSFGGLSSTSSLFPSATTSRATSPGATTDGDSAAEDPDAEKHEQINLTSGGPGEEDEEVVFEIRVKARQFTNKEGAESPWETKGLGPLRILKHKETKATRMLLRADPRGTIVFNKAILNFKYEATGSTVKLTTAGENDGGFETWIVQVKTAEGARQLAEALEANKSA